MPIAAKYPGVELRIHATFACYRSTPSTVNGITPAAAAKRHHLAQLRGFHTWNTADALAQLL